MTEINVLLLALAFGLLCISMISMSKEIREIGLLRKLILDIYIYLHDKDGVTPLEIHNSAIKYANNDIDIFNKKEV